MSNATIHIKTEKQHIPALRFKGFEGVWSKEKAGVLCDCIVPGRNKPKKFDGDIAWITTPDIVHSSYIFNSKSGLGISKEEAKSVGSKIAPKNSVIISCVGDLGLVAIAGVELVINQQLHAFLPSEKVEYRFLMYSITTQGRYIDRVATKTAVPYMNKNNCNSIPVYLPSLPEQQKIASFLSAVDEKIQQLTKKKALLEQYKKGVMQQLFSGQLRFKDENGNDFSDWRKLQLSNIAERVKTKNKIDNQNVLTISAQLGLVSQLEYFNKSVSAKNLTSYYLLEKGDFAYNKSYSNGYPMGAIKRLKKYDLGVVSTLYICFRFNNNVSLNFMEQYFETGLQNREIEKVAQEGARNHGLLNIGVNDFFDIDLKLPSKEEQQKIANYLSAIDTKIEAVNNQITQTQTYKKGLLQQLFV